MMRRYFFSILLLFLRPTTCQTKEPISPCIFGIRDFLCSWVIGLVSEKRIRWASTLFAKLRISPFSCSWGDKPSVTRYAPRVSLTKKSGFIDVLLYQNYPKSQNQNLDKMNILEYRRTSIMQIPMA